MFYHALETHVTGVLFELLKKSLEQSKRILVRTDSFETAEKLSNDLWKFQDNYVLPHGLVCEEMPDKQPILLTYHQENLNNADYIFFIGQVEIADFSDFADYQRAIVIFDDTSDAIKDHMRQEFKKLKQNKIQVTYYQQRQGKWHENSN